MPLVPLLGEQFTVFHAMSQDGSSRCLAIVLAAPIVGDRMVADGSTAAIRPLTFSS